jgi:FAD/FMN-containing dehydrogenase
MAAPLSTSGAGTGLASSWDHLRTIGSPDQWREAGPEDAVAGVQPRMIFEPRNETEVATALRVADNAGLSVIPRGGGTKTAWGNPPARADLILSTVRMNQVIEHAWADLTASVESGCTIGTLQNALAQHGQQIAVDPLWPEQATIGGILSTNDTGTLRIRYGGLRDLIIGVTIALPDGTLASSGGKVVKNVAGYDLPKLVTGALGTLGIITRAIFRLHPLPHNVRSFTFVPRDAADANRLVLAVQDSKLAHTGLQVRFNSGAAPEIDIRFDGTDAGLEAQTETLRKLVSPATETQSNDDVWHARQHLFGAARLNRSKPWSAASLLSSVALAKEDARPIRGRHRRTSGLHLSLFTSHLFPFASLRGPHSRGNWFFHQSQITNHILPPSLFARVRPTVTRGLRIPAAGIQRDTSLIPMGAGPIIRP